MNNDYQKHNKVREIQKEGFALAANEVSKCLSILSYDEY